jgi:uncharacterized glyoxalase superfamily protein PhnB
MKSSGVVAAVPVLPAYNFQASLSWWTDICGFQRKFVAGDYGGIERDGVNIHLCEISDKSLAKTVGEQTMVRVQVKDMKVFLNQFKEHGGEIHPNSPLQTKPWGTREFAAVDPNGVCVTFFE